MMTIDWSALNQAIPEPASVLPHRDPLLLLERVCSISETEVVSEMCLQIGAPVFTGHFPGDPTVPGVYLIEAMAQTLAFHQRLLYPDQNVLLAAIKSAKFRSVVRPGDLVLMEVEVLKSKLKFVEGLGVAKVGGNIVAEVHCLGARVPFEEG
jgi:3-hydroxyacyl-[acyl-carrier-protein] dehydratase